MKVNILITETTLEMLEGQQNVIPMLWLGKGSLIEAEYNELRNTAIYTTKDKDGNDFFLVLTPGVDCKIINEATTADHTGKILIYQKELALMIDVLITIVIAPMLENHLLWTYFGTNTVDEKIRKSEEFEEFNQRLMNESNNVSLSETEKNTLMVLKEKEHVMTFLLKLFGNRVLYIRRLSR